MCGIFGIEGADDAANLAYLGLYALQHRGQESSGICAWDGERMHVEPGMVRSVAYNVVLIAGVSTLLFNINPLLRFDGYYIFSDLIEIPNLRTRANRHFTYLTERFLLGEVAREQTRTLREIAQAAQLSDDEAEPLLFGLRMMGYLTTDGTRYRVGNWFFERWLRRTGGARGDAAARAGA